MSEYLNSYINNMKNTASGISKILESYNNINIEIIKANINQISKRLDENTTYINNYYHNSFTKLLDEYQKNIAKIISNIQFEDYLKKYFELSEELKNPNINLDAIADKLSDVFWCQPFEMNIQKLNNALSICKTPDEFDDFILNYYTDEKINTMCEFIENSLNDNLLIYFNESIYAFNNNKYTLAALGLLNVFEGCTLFFVKDKSSTKKKEIFRILYDLVKDDEKYDIHDRFNLKIMQNHINSLYCTHKGNEICIDGNKRIQRTIDSHGRGVKKDRIDNIRILNSLYELIRLTKVFEQYKDYIEL